MSNQFLKSLNKECCFRNPKTGKPVFCLVGKTHVYNNLIKKLFPGAYSNDNSFLLALGFSQERINNANEKGYWA